MATGVVRIVLCDCEQEESHLLAIVAQCFQGKTSLFVGRFLSDLSLPEATRLLWSRSNVVLRQYGCCCYVNAASPLADAGRVEMGLEDAEAALRSGAYSLVVLSQILTAVEEDLVTPSDLLALMRLRPEHVTLVLSGRQAPAEIVARGEISHVCV